TPAPAPHTSPFSSPDPPPTPIYTLSLHDALPISRGQRSQGDPAPGAGTAAAWRSPGRVRCCTHQQPSPSYDAELSPSALVTVTVPPGTVSVRELKAADVARPGSSSVTVRLPKSVEIVTSTGSSPVLATRAVT